MGKKFDEQMICNCSLSRKWWWGSIKVFDSPTKFLVYLDKEGSIDFDQANVKKVTVAYLCNRIDDGGGEFEGTDSHWAVCEPTANGAFAVWEINLSNLYSDHPSPEMVCPTCQGKGYTFPGTNEQYDGVIYCRTCNGTGKVPSPEPPEKVRETDKLLLTDEDLNQAWWDCYGEELPAIHGLVFGRTVRSRQILKLQLAGWGNLKEAQAENAKLKREIDSLIHDSDQRERMR